GEVVRERWAPRVTQASKHRERARSDAIARGNPEVVRPIRVEVAEVWRVVLRRARTLGGSRGEIRNAIRVLGLDSTDPWAKRSDPDATPRILVDRIDVPGKQPLGGADDAENRRLEPEETPCPRSKPDA